MGSLKVNLKLDASGPLANGGMAKAADKWTENTSQALADEAVRMLKAFPMDKSGRSKGGFAANLNPVRKSLNTMVIHGPTVRGVTWAPWLEGITDRNRSTKFRGYHLFRKTAAALNRIAPDIGQKELDKLLGETGSG